MYPVVVTSKVVQCISRWYEVMKDSIDAADDGEMFEVVFIDDFKLQFCFEPEDESEEQWRYGVSFWYNDYVIFNIDVYDFEDLVIQGLENWEGLVIKFCCCKSPIYSEKSLCKRCYVYAEVKPDVCCMCTENEEECWVTFSGCAHSIHLRCSLELSECDCERKMCPSCQKVSHVEIPVLPSRRKVYL